MNVDIVIVSWAKDEELYNVTKNCIDSLIRDAGKIFYYIYIIESNKDINYDNYTNNPNVKIFTIYTDEEFNYNKYLNIGVFKGNSEYVVLCNSDISFESNWATEIIKWMNIDKNLLSASPACPETGPIIQDLNPIYGYEIGKQIAGWCIFQKREIYEIIKKLNEEVVFHYSDYMYREQLHEHKIKHALIPGSIVHHHQGGLGITARLAIDDNTRGYYTSRQHAKYLEINKYSL